MTQKQKAVEFVEGSRVCRRQQSLRKVVESAEGSRVCGRQQSLRKVEEFAEGSRVYRRRKVVEFEEGRRVRGRQQRRVAQIKQATKKTKTIVRKSQKLAALQAREELEMRARRQGGRRQGGNGRGEVEFIRYIRG